MLAAMPELTREDEDGTTGSTPIRTFLPDPEFTAEIVIKEHLPQIAVREVRSKTEIGAFPAGMGQALRTFTFTIWIYAREYKSAEDAKEFCRAAARNVETIFVRYPLGFPAGRWLNTIPGETEYVLVKLTDRFWGVAAQVPLTVQMIADVDEIRGC